MIKNEGVPKSEMMELNVVARRWSSAEAISCKVGNCFALSGSQRHDSNSSLGTPKHDKTSASKTKKDEYGGTHKER